jgi:hypothetical protein
MHDKAKLVCFLLGDSPASEFYKPTFRNTLSVPSYKIQTPGNHPEENIQHTEHGEGLKSKKAKLAEVHTIHIHNVTHC